MKEEKFLQLQYETLRKEIEEAHGRAFKIIIGGLTIVPAIWSAIRSLDKAIDLGPVTLLLPFIVVVTVLLFLAQNAAIMRCGRYIRLNIENAVPSIIGWETWLEKPREAGEPDLRGVDKYLIRSFYVL